MPEATGPSCDEKVRFSGEAKLGRKVTCPHCGEILEVVELIPLELDYALEDEDEDYEYEAWDDDEV
jgi:lysine biosynthesis protein LysW